MRSFIEGIFLESCNDACRISYYPAQIYSSVAEGIGLENYLIRNVAALRNFQCNVCLRKIKTLRRHALFEFLSRRIGSSGAHKRTLVATKEDLQEGNNLLL